APVRSQRRRAAPSRLAPDRSASRRRTPSKVLPRRSAPASEVKDQSPPSALSSPNVQPANVLPVSLQPVNEASKNEQLRNEQATKAAFSWTDTLKRTLPNEHSSKTAPWSASSIRSRSTKWTRRKTSPSRSRSSQSPGPIVVSSVTMRARPLTSSSPFASFGSGRSASHMPPTEQPTSQVSGSVQGVTKV